jgi:hypothetical protein
MYFQDMNIVKGYALTDKSGASYRTAYLQGIAWYELTVRGRETVPHFEVCDNALDSLSVAMLNARGTTFQLVAPGNHGRNDAEKHIQTYENYLICCFATLDPTYPKKARKLLIPHVNIVINLLRASHLQPHLSAWEDLKGPFNFDATPLAEPGRPAVIWESPEHRLKMAHHGVDAFYIGPALNHYRCYTFYVPSTDSTRISDSVGWLPYTNERTALANPEAFLPPPPLASRAPTLPPPQLPRSAPPPPAPPPASEGAPLAQPLPIPRPPKPPKPPRPPKPVTAPAPPPPPLPPTSSRQHRRHPSRYADNATDWQPRDLRNATASRPAPASEGANPPADPAYDAGPESDAASRAPAATTASTSRSSATGPVASASFVRALILTGGCLSALNAPGSRTRCAFTARPAPASPLQQLDDNGIPVPPSHPGETSYRSLRRGPDQAEWDASFATEMRRLIFKTESIKWIPSGKVPAGRSATYANPVGRIKIVDGQRTFRVRLTYGGNNSDFDGLRTSHTVDIATVKMFFNAIVTEDAAYVTLDLEDFYLFTVLDKPEYMRMPITYIPHDLRLELGMGDLPDDASVLWEINKGLYGMPQAGLLAKTELNKLLATHGYHECVFTQGLYRHATRPISFTVWVDDFLIKFKRGANKDDINHLLDVLRLKYKFKIDWHGRQYLGLKIDYRRTDRRNRSLTISIPGYAARMNAELGIARPAHDPKSPISYVAPSYTSGPQWETIDDSPRLDAKGIQFVQRIVGKCLFYGRMVAPSIELATNTIGSTQAKATQQTLKAAMRLCHYLAWHPDHSITYYPSTMRLHIHSDASHQSEPGSSSRAGGAFFMGNPAFTGPSSSSCQRFQGAVATVCKRVPTVCQASSESEYATAYINAQTGEVLRQTAADLGYPQAGPTPIIFDNSVAGQIANNTCKLKRAKAIAMRYHWLRDRVAMGHFVMVWRPGPHNLADFLTKAHPIHHYIAMEPFFNSSRR